MRKIHFRKDEAFTKVNGLTHVRVYALSVSTFSLSLMMSTPRLSHHVISYLKESGDQGSFSK